MPDSADIVHLLDNAAACANKPYLLTVDGNGQPGEQFPPNTVFVSRNHAANHGSRHFVHNGLDRRRICVFGKARGLRGVSGQGALEGEKFSRRGGGGAAGGNRIARARLAQLAVELAKTAPANSRRALLWHDGGPEKRELLSPGALPDFSRALGRTVWHLAITEALVSGAYVVGTPYGSLPEIVTPETGVLSAKADELVEAVKNPQRFSPQACRDRVLRGGFTHLDMARKYLKYYEQVLTHGSLGEAREPRRRPGRVSWRNSFCRGKIEFNLRA